MSHWNWDLWHGSSSMIPGNIVFGTKKIKEQILRKEHLLSIQFHHNSDLIVREKLTISLFSLYQWTWWILRHVRTCQRVIHSLKWGSTAAFLRDPTPQQQQLLKPTDKATKARSCEDPLVSVYKCHQLHPDTFRVQWCAENSATCWLWERNVATSTEG